MPERTPEAHDLPELALQEGAARLVVERLRARAVWRQGMGVLQRWSGCDQAQANTWLREGHDTNADPQAEASRIVAALDAGAVPGADLDAGWD